jgi:hypothetical protein
MPPKENPKLKPHGKREQKAKKLQHQIRGPAGYKWKRGEKFAILRLINALLQPELRLSAVAIPR